MAMNSVLFDKINSFQYKMIWVDGRRVKKGNGSIITLEMLTELEKNGGWVQLPKTLSLYHIDTRYLIGDAYVHWMVTSFGD